MIVLLSILIINLIKIMLTKYDVDLTEYEYIVSLPNVYLITYGAIKRSIYIKSMIVLWALKNINYIFSITKLILPFL